MALSKWRTEYRRSRHFGVWISPRLMNAQLVAVASLLCFAQASFAGEMQDKWKLIEDRGKAISATPKTVSLFPDLDTNTSCLSVTMSGYITVMLLNETMDDGLLMTNALIQGIAKGRLEEIRKQMGIDSDIFTSSVTNPAIEAFKSKAMPEKQQIFANCADIALKAIK